MLTKRNSDINLHSSTSTADHNKDDHVTVRVSSEALRAEQKWYTVHWRPNGGGVYLPNPDSQANKDKKKAKRDAQKAKKNETQEDGSGGNGSRGVASSQKNS